MLFASPTNLLSSLFYSSKECYKGHIELLDLSDASERNLQLLFTIPKIFFSDLKYLMIRALEPVDSVVRGVLSNGQFTNLKIFTFCSYGRLYNSKPILECLCAFHPRLDHIGFGSASHSDITTLCKYVSLHFQSGSSEFSLALTGNVFVDGSLRFLISAIAISKTLTHLDISCCDLSLVELEMFSVALSTNTSLQSLGLDNCSIHGKGAELLSNELEGNHTLLGIDLRNNYIDANGAAALASMLAVNTSLKILYLSHNEQIGEVGALRLISAVQEDNKTLQKLTLPAECEPIEYGSMLMDNVRKSGRIKFIKQDQTEVNTIAHEFASSDILWPYQ